MAPSSCIDIGDADRRRLLEIARASIAAGIAGGSALLPSREGLSAGLLAPLGVFVTITRDGRLRGCMGALESEGPLAQSAAASAYNAAFSDGRFDRLESAEIDHICIEVSILSRMEPMIASDRTGLLRQLRPRVDGLLLQDGHHRSTFLPRVWEKIGAPEDFLAQLLTKAGLPVDHWSETIRFSRYHTVSFAEDQFFGENPAADRRQQ